MKELTALMSETMVTMLLEKRRMRVTMLRPLIMLRPMKVSVGAKSIYENLNDVFHQVHTYSL